MSRFSDCHSGVSRNLLTRYNIPAFAGMTILLLGLIIFLFPHHAFAQSLTLDLGGKGAAAGGGDEAGGGSVAGRVIQTVLLLTVLSIAPSLLMMMTSFTRIIVVLSFLRTALGTQTTPPNTVLLSLAMFLTFFVMAPTFQASYDQGIKPIMEGSIDEMEGMQKAVGPKCAILT